MVRLTRTAYLSWACSSIVAAVLLCCASCDLTLGPKIERRAIIIASGVPVEIIESRKLECHALNETEVNPFQQDVGGWIAMPPDHWKTVKSEIERLRKKCGELSPEKKE